MQYEDASRRRGEDLDPNSQETNTTSFGCFNGPDADNGPPSFGTPDSSELPRKHIHTGLGRIFIPPGPSFSCLADGKNGFK